jgi:hypothetical protein
VQQQDTRQNAKKEFGLVLFQLGLHLHAQHELGSFTLVLPVLPVLKIDYSMSPLLRPKPCDDLNRFLWSRYQGHLDSSHFSDHHLTWAMPLNLRLASSVGSEFIINQVIDTRVIDTVARLLVRNLCVW